MTATTPAQDAEISRAPLDSTPQPPAAEDRARHPRARPLLCIAETIPAASICSTRRAARL